MNPEDLRRLSMACFGFSAVMLISFAVNRKIQNTPSK